MDKIVIVVKDGCVEEVYATANIIRSGTDVEIIDYDTTDPDLYIVVADREQAISSQLAKLI